MRIPSRTLDQSAYRVLLPGCLGVTAIFLVLFGPIVPAAKAKIEIARLVAADGAEGDQFGRDVAIDGDTMVVGAYRDDDSRGSAYVFTRVNGVWSQAAKLTASDGVSQDWFGTDVSISGDTVVVNGPKNYFGTNQGTAYVFVKPMNGWTDMTENARLTASDGGQTDAFVAVAISGDTIVVGSEGGAPGGAGSAYLFEKPPHGWEDMTETAKLIASDVTSADNFGGPIAFDGETVVVGAYAADAAYVFVKPGSGWSNITETAKLTTSDIPLPESIHHFGGSVAVDGDVIVIGAPHRTFTTYGAQEGAAYIFVKPAAGWSDMTQTARISASLPTWRAHFGQSVGISSDTIIAGAELDESSGSIYQFQKPENGWASVDYSAKFCVASGAFQVGVGNRVAISGDTIVAGARNEVIGANDYQGSVYIFDIATPEPAQPLAAPAPHDQRKNRYVSFLPTATNGLVAYQVTKTTSPTGIGWVGMPGGDGTAPVVDTPVFREWCRPVNVGDCEIVPDADYQIRETSDGVAFSAPLEVSTIDTPDLNFKKWGDIVGVNNGVSWTPPNKMSNINDVLAILAFNSGSPIKPTFAQVNLQGISFSDACLNAFVNTADVLAAVKAVAGDPYPFTTDPALCPVCP